LILSGCTTPALQSTPSDVENLRQDQGVIIGSVMMKARDEAAMFPISLAEKTWYAGIKRSDAGFFASGRGLYIKAEGKEVPFVAVLAPGVYVLEELFSQGLAPNYSVRVNVRFVVEEKKNIYIGRLAITIPRNVGVLDSLLFKSRRVDVTVEDAQSDTMAALTSSTAALSPQALKKAL
jgi:hypothetical protein